MDWLKEKVADLISEFDAGGSATDIAKSLSIKFQEEVSRSAVLGKLHRMKMTRERPVVKKVEPERPKLRRRQVASTPKRPPTFIKWEFEPPALFRCSIYQLTGNRCHWPFGDRPPFLYCGATVAKRSYCYYHHKRSLRAPPRQYPKPNPRSESGPISSTKPKENKRAKVHK